MTAPATSNIGGIGRSIRLAALWRASLFGVRAVHQRLIKSRSHLHICTVHIFQMLFMKLDLPRKDIWLGNDGRHESGERRRRLRAKDAHLLLSPLQLPNIGSCLSRVISFPFVPVALSYLAPRCLFRSNLLF